MSDPCASDEDNDSGSDSLVMTVRPECAEFRLTISIDVGDRTWAVECLQRACAQLAETLPEHSTLTPTHFGDGDDVFAGSEHLNRPEGVLEHILLEMTGHLVEAKKQVAMAIVHEKVLQKQTSAEREIASEWKKKAFMAIKADRDELAKQALLRESEHQELAVDYERQWTGQKVAVDQLKSGLQELNGKIEEIKRRKSLLIARAQRSTAHQAVTNALRVLDTQRLDTVFARLEAEVAAVETEADTPWMPQPEPGSGDSGARSDSPATPTLSAVRARVSVALAVEADFWSRAKRVASAEDALRAFVLQTRESNPAFDVHVGRPAFCVRDPEAYRPALIALYERRTGASPPTELVTAAVRQRSLDLDEVEVGLGASRT